MGVPAGIPRSKNPRTPIILMGWRVESCGLGREIREGAVRLRIRAGIRSDTAGMRPGKPQARRGTPPAGGGPRRKEMAAGH